jgi:sulfur dioxygenase
VTESLTHTVIVNQMRAENCFAYLIADADTREATLVDPRADRVEDYLRDLEARGLRLRSVIETHTHADHISGAAELRARTGAEVLVSDRATSEVATGRLRDGDRISVGGQEIQVLASPGHTDDSISLLVGGVLLTGDALLVGGAGRTDFQNGSPEALYDTLHRRFAGLSGDLTVYPGHDYTGRTHSTLAQERQTNALLRLTERDRFVSTLRAGRQPKPANMDVIVAANIWGLRPSPASRSRNSPQRLMGRRRRSSSMCACPRSTRRCILSPVGYFHSTRSPGVGTSCREIVSWCSSAARAHALGWPPRSSVGFARASSTEDSSPGKRRGIQSSKARPT